MNGLVVINWPLVIICGLILIFIIGFLIYFFRLLIKALKLYIKNVDTHSIDQAFQNAENRKITK